MRRCDGNINLNQYAILTAFYGHLWVRRCDEKKLMTCIIFFLAVLVTSSCSTDETVVADSDVELETVTSNHTPVTINLVESAEDESSKKDYRAENVPVVESAENESGGNTAALRTSEHESQGFLPLNRDTFKTDYPYRSSVKTDNVNITLSGDRNEGTLTRKDKDHSSESENPDIIYSQGLIVRKSNLQKSRHSPKDGALIDFKHFRKVIDPMFKSVIMTLVFDNCVNQMLAVYRHCTLFPNSTHDFYCYYACLHRLKHKHSHIFSTWFSIKLSFL